MILYLIGGRPCSGKSTLVDKISSVTHIPVLHMDQFEESIISFATQANPEIYKWKTKDFVNILQDSAETLFFDYIKYYD